MWSVPQSLCINSFQPRRQPVPKATDRTPPHFTHIRGYTPAHTRTYNAHSRAHMREVKEAIVLKVGGRSHNHNHHHTITTVTKGPSMVWPRL